MCRVRYIPLLLHTIFSYDIALRDMYIIMNEMDFIQDFGKEMALTMNADRQRIRNPVEIINEDNAFFTYAAIDKDFNILMRTINTSDPDNPRDANKTPLMPYLENVYFIFEASKSNKSARDIVYDVVHTNIDEYYAAIYNIKTPTEGTSSIILINMEEVPTYMLNLRYMPTDQIKSKFRQINRIERSL